MKPLHSYLYVALGGAMGTFIRVIVSTLFPIEFSYHIVIINVLGSFVLAWLYTKYSTGQKQQLRLTFGVGLLGGFTTMSTFALDVIHLIDSGLFTPVIFYIICSVLGSIIAAITGYKLANKGRS